MTEQVQRAGGAQIRTSVERRGDRELVITRTFDAPPSTVYRAWSQPELFQRWWVPKSAPGISLVSCDMDVRTGGKYIRPRRRLRKRCRARLSHCRSSWSSSTNCFPA
ncbi:START-like domain-containing protein (plasmid) [Rhizobium sp. N1314]|nr:START-like domain-containing protein [Rhizobium sp. N731]ANL19466.1 START-like domain-containing protein [Rhizobium sp. N1314]